MTIVMQLVQAGMFGVAEDRTDMLATQGQGDSQVALKAIASRQACRVDPAAHWFNEARFGMFIHWGLYSVPAGTLNGKRTGGLGEWIASESEDLEEYTAVFSEAFTGAGFDAREYVRLAKSCGMRYITLVTKHHEGFCLWDTDYTANNSVDGSAARRDFVRELSDACREAGLKLGLYYSVADWYHEDFPANLHIGYHRIKGNPGDSKRYGEFMKAQLRELLSNHGRVEMLWYDQDQAFHATEPELCEEIDRMVEELQPGILVNRDWGPYTVKFGASEQIAPNRSGESGAFSEVCLTMSETWGYMDNDTYRDFIFLLGSLCRNAGKGANTLLNIGPMGDGTIPPEQVEILGRFAAWMDVNAESIHGTTAGPFDVTPWGAVTAKPGRLYFHIIEWPGAEFAVNGLKNRVTSAYMLADKDRTPLHVTQTYDERLDVHRLSVALPENAPDANVSVLVLGIEGEPQVDNALVQLGDGRIHLPVWLAEIHDSPSDRPVRVGHNGAIENWYDTDAWLSWKVKVTAPGDYEVRVINAKVRHGRYIEGHRVRVGVGGESIDGVVKEDESHRSFQDLYCFDVTSRIGRIHVADVGEQAVTLEGIQLFSATGVKGEPWARPLTFAPRSVELVPVD